MLGSLPHLGVKKKFTIHAQMSSFEHKFALSTAAPRCKLPPGLLRALSTSVEELGAAGAGGLTLDRWKKIWRAHRKVARRMLGLMEYTLIKLLPDGEAALRQVGLQDLMKPSLLPDSEALAAARRLPLASQSAGDWLREGRWLA